VKEVKTPQTCQPIKTLHLTREAFQNKNTSAQSRLGEHGPLIERISVNSALAE